MKNKIIVIGSLNYDIILKQQRMANKGETYAVDGATFCSGGKGANQAVQSSKLGAEVYMVGAVGNDAMGQYLRDTITQYGVIDKYLKTVEEVSGMGIVNCLEDGSVFANIVRGANDKITKEDIDALDSLLNECKIMILQLEVPVSVVEYAIEKAIRFNVKVILNAAPAIELSERFLEKCDYIIVNEVESSYYCNKNIDDVETAKKEIMSFAKKYQVNAIFTVGKEGAIVCDGEEIQHIPACKVNAIETTGAGDSFVGAMGHCLVSDMDIFEGAKFATCCSALTVCGIGAQPSMPTLEQVQKFDKERLVNGEF